MLHSQFAEMTNKTTQTSLGFHFPRTILLYESLLLQPSMKSHTRETTMKIIKKTETGFVMTALVKSPLNSRIAHLIPPHPGQGSPVILLKGQVNGIPNFTEHATAIKATMQIANKVKNPLNLPNILSITFNFVTSS